MYSGLALLYQSAVKNPVGDVHTDGGSSPSEVPSIGVKLTTSPFVKIGHYYGWLIFVRVIWLICSSFKNVFIVLGELQVLEKERNTKNCKHNLPSLLFVLGINC